VDTVFAFFKAVSNSVIKSWSSGFFYQVSKAAMRCVAKIFPTNSVSAHDRLMSNQTCGNMFLAFQDIFPFLEDQQKPLL